MSAPLNLTKSVTSDELWSARGQQLPPSIYLGTSTWAFPEWKGVLYKKTYKSERAFTRESLAEYAESPWFRTVCIDSSFYKPAKGETLALYAAQVPAYFKWVSKVWERITIHTYPKHPRYGALSGQKNPDFLNADLLKDAVFSQFEAKEVLERTGPFILQFAPFSERVLPYGEFVEDLGVFLAKLPKEFRYAVEVRNRQIITERYLQVLNTNGATHCFNHWSSMPPLHEVMKLLGAWGGLTADFYLGRLLTPLGLSYEAAEKQFAPYNSLQAVNPSMRGDVLRLAKRALGVRKDLFVTANNKAEGCAPLTVASLGELILEHLSSESNS